MGSPRLSVKRSLLLSMFIALCLFSAVAVAQKDRPTATNGGDDTATTERQSQKTSEPTRGRTTTSSSSRAQQTTQSQQKETTSESSTAAKTTSASLPPLSSSSSSTSSAGKLTGLPTLTRQPIGGAVPTYPPPSPPPTQNAPFMNRSTLPDGTVFIAVGSILGAFGAAVLIWRGVVACLLHRSVEKAAMAQHAANDKAAFPAPPAPFYNYTDRESSLSLATGTATGRGQRRTHRGPTPSATPSQTNLFFSPTASGGGGIANSGNRESRYLPSGFYAATSASPAHGHANSISLSNLRPASRGHMGPSPPDSPSLGPRGTPTPRNFSTSSFNLNHPPSERAPSAFLDDLLDEQPGAFPPPGGPGSHHRTFSASTQGRR